LPAGSACRPDSRDASDTDLRALEDPCAGSLLDYRVNTSVTRGGKRGPRASEAKVSRTPWWSAARRAGPRHGPAVPSVEGTGPTARRATGCGGFRTSALRRSAPLERGEHDEDTSQNPGRPRAAATRDCGRTQSRDDMTACTNLSTSCPRTAVRRTASLRSPMSRASTPWLQSKAWMHRTSALPRSVM
jgi:hypothetical protein